jgi:hypothetical protein
MADTKLPQWMDKVDVGTVAVLTLDDGERLTVEVRDINDERGELIVDVVSSKLTHPNTLPSRSIPMGSVVSFERRPRSEQPWPYSDPCRVTSFSFARFALMAMLLVCMIVGSVPLFLFLIGKPYGVQAASAIVYTISVVFFTFARIGTRTGKDLPPYMFTCPAVQAQFSRLIRRHISFLIVLFAFQTLALNIRPDLPDWWNTDRRGTPFEIALSLVCCGIGYAQVFTNRRLLDRAHRESPS